MPLGHLSKLHVAPVDLHQASVDVWTCQPWSPQPDLLRNTAFPIEGMKQKNFSSIRHPSLLCLEGLGETNLDQRKPKTSSKFFIFKGRFLHLPSLPWNFGMEIWISFGDLALSRKVHWPARWNDTTSLKCQTVVNQLICPKLRSSIFFSSMDLWIPWSCYISIDTGFPGISEKNYHNLSIISFKNGPLKAADPETLGFGVYMCLLRTGSPTLVWNAAGSTNLVVDCLK